jgi:hypothetical protein
MPADDEPITLKDASEIYFRGKVSVDVLKAEVKKANLTASKIGRSYFTTITELRAMVERCRVKAEGHISGSTRTEIDGPSSTGNAALALASLQRSFTKPKGRSRNTSQTNIQ